MLSWRGCPGIVVRLVAVGLFAALFAGAYAGVASAQGPVAAYSFDEGSGTV